MAITAMKLKAENDTKRLYHAENNYTESIYSTAASKSGTYTFDSSTPICESYSIKQDASNANARMYWTDTTVYSQGSTECYIRFNTLENHFNIFLHASNPYSTGRLGVVLSSGNYYLIAGMYFDNPGITWYNLCDDVSNPFIVTTGVTYHFMMTWGSEGLKLFINGTLHAINADCAGKNVYSGNDYWGIFLVASSAGTPWYAARATIDEWRFNTTERRGTWVKSIAGGPKYKINGVIYTSIASIGGV